MKFNHVYSGKLRACMCGCKGKHTYTSASTESAKEWGTVSDKAVAAMSKKVLALLPRTDVQCGRDGDMVWVDTDTRSYVLYG